jgi:hypothetical protein
VPYSLSFPDEVSREFGGDEIEQALVPDDAPKAALGGDRLLVVERKTGGVFLRIGREQEQGAFREAVCVRG